MAKGKTAFIGFALLVFPILLGLGFRFFKGTPQQAPKLPHFYAVTPDSGIESEHTFTVKDTAYHILPPFEFTDQDGKKVTEQTFANNILVADFVFTTCPGLCPLMTGAMKRVQDEMLGKVENLMFLTHTVDPERDTPERLKTYGEKFEADFEKWKFVTGSKEDLFDVCANGYMLSCKEGSEGTEEFDHSGRLVLLDRNRIIRGYYMGTDKEAVTKLIGDIFLLQLEYEKKDRDVRYRYDNTADEKAAKKQKS